MSIFVIQELALQIYTLKNISIIQQGSYFLRFNLYYRDFENNKITLSTPRIIIQNQKQKQINIKESQIIDNFYVSPQLPLKFQVFRFPIQQHTIQINQICIFRISIDNSIMCSNINLTLYCQLLLYQPFHKQVNQLTKCCTFEMDIKNFHYSQFLQITFPQKYFCVIKGSVHMISYKYEFKSNQQKIIKKRKLALETKIKSHIKSIEQEIVEQQAIYHNLQEYIKSKPKEETEKMLHYFLDVITEESTYIHTMYRYYLTIIQDKKINISEEQFKHFQQVLQQEKGRKKIFQTSTIRHFQDKMHNLGARLYYLWGNFIQIINKLSSTLLEILQQKYQLKVNKFYGHYLIRNEIEGDWTVEKNEDYGQDHLSTSITLRNTVLQHQIGLNLIDKSIFLNLKCNPIIFQEIYINPNHSQQRIYKIKSESKRLFIFVHGFGACRYDMQMMMLQIKKKFLDIECYISSSNQGKTSADINILGERLANQVIRLMNQYAKQNKQILNISFIGHSMGGIIIRAALPKLQQYKDKFCVYISLATPHVGYLYNPSKLTDFGLWIINNIEKTQSLLQLTMQQHEKIEKTFIYKLSNQKGIQWFSKIALVSSYQDSYVPFQSARIAKIKKSLHDEKNGIQKGKIYNKMIDNIMHRIKSSKVYRIDVNFAITQETVNSLIGRAAHLYFIECRQFIKMFITACQHLFK